MTSTISDKLCQECLDRKRSYQRDWSQRKKALEKDKQRPDAASEAQEESLEDDDNHSEDDVDADTDNAALLRGARILANLSKNTEGDDRCRN